MQARTGNSDDIAVAGDALAGDTRSTEDEGTVDAWAKCRKKKVEQWVYVNREEDEQYF